MVAYRISLLVLNFISHDWAQWTSEISSWTLKKKFHIYMRPYINQYVCFILRARSGIVQCFFCSPSWVTVFQVAHATFSMLQCTSVCSSERLNFVGGEFTVAWPVLSCFVLSITGGAPYECWSAKTAISLERGPGFSEGDDDISCSTGTHMFIVL